MRIAFLTQYYPPEIGAPQARISENVRRLKEAGHECMVLTAMPNYPRGVIHEGYGGLYQKDVVEGVPVTRTWIHITKKVGTVARLSNYFSFVVSSVLLGCWSIRKADILVVESPPLFLGISGILISRLIRARLVANISDLWPESVVQMGMISRGGFAHRISSSLEHMLYRFSWRITGQSREIVSDIAERMPSKSVVRLSNGVDVERFGPNLRSELIRTGWGGNEKCHVVYAGLHGLAQGLDIVLDAAALLEADSSIHFNFIGDGPDKLSLLEKAESMSLTNVTFIDPVPRTEVPELVASADIILAPLKFRLPGAVPSKIYEAMGARKPLVVVAEGEPRMIVEDMDCGKCVSLGDHEGLAQAIRELAFDPELRARLGANGREAAEGEYNRDLIFKHYLDALELGTTSRKESKPDEEMT